MSAQPRRQVLTIDWPSFAEASEGEPSGLGRRSCQFEPGPRSPGEAEWNERV